MTNLYKFGEILLIFLITLFILNQGEVKTGDYVADLVGWLIKCSSALPIAVLVYFTFSI